MISSPLAERTGHHSHADVVATRWHPTTLEWAFLSLPLLYVLGLAGFLWPAIGLGCLLVLHDRKDSRMPFGSWAFAVGIVWAALSSLALLSEGLGALLLGGYRWAVFVSTLGVFLFIANQLDREGARRVVSTAMTTVWFSLVGFALLSFVMPELSYRTPAQIFIPRAFLANSYLVDLTRFQVSEIQMVLGDVSTRPSAPFAYANGWGSAYVLAAPFAYLSLIHRRRGLARTLGTGTFFVGTLVAIASLNRAVWLLLVISACYAVFRSEHRFRNLAAIVPLALAGLWVALSFTPIGTLVSERLEIAGESDRTRSSVVTQSIETALESPGFGYGAPIEGFGAIPIGTHGLLWFLLVSYGLVVTVLIVGWMLGAFAASWRLRSADGRAAHIVLLVALCQLPVYGLLPQLPLVGAAAALAYRCTQDVDGDLHD